MSLLDHGSRFPTLLRRRRLLPHNGLVVYPQRYRLGANGTFVNIAHPGDFTPIPLSRHQRKSDPTLGPTGLPW